VIPPHASGAHGRPPGRPAGEAEAADHRGGDDQNVQQLGRCGGDRRAEQRHGEDDQDRRAQAAAASAAVGVGAVRNPHDCPPAGGGALPVADLEGEAVDGAR
jgi:hypothetical protein